MTWVSKLKTKTKIKWLIKADDDVAINAELLAEKLTALKPFDQIYCHIRWFAQPNRKEGSKWKVGKNKWPEPNYPMYCHGPCYMMTPLIAEKLLKNHQDFGGGQFKRFEDLYP